MAEELKQETAQAAEAAQASAPAAKQGKKKWPITVAVIVIVLVLAGAGAWAWHGTAGFCGTVCHDSMSEHVDNYNGTDASHGAGLASWHATNEGTTCLDCHQATLSTQLTELQSQLAGDTDNLGLSDRYYTDNDTCLTCHGDTYDSLAEKTASLGEYNPHNSPHGQLNCNECHKGHSEQVNTCGECHDNGGQTMRGTLASE